jgi:hypothetical protein
MAVVAKDIGHESTPEYPLLARRDPSKRITGLVAEHLVLATMFIAGSRSREHSREPSYRPASGNTNFRSEERDMAKFDADDYVDDDNVMPIPIFQVQTDDDDTISCITTSVTSHYEMELDWGPSMVPSQPKVCIDGRKLLRRHFRRNC